jgi:hypothetical protein
MRKLTIDCLASCSLCTCLQHLCCILELAEQLASIVSTLTKCLPQALLEAAKGRAAGIDNSVEYKQRIQWLRKSCSSRLTVALHTAAQGANHQHPRVTMRDQLDALCVSLRVRSSAANSVSFTSNQTITPRQVQHWPMGVKLCLRMWQI